MDEPTWLNEPLFENVLQNIEKNKTIAVSGITIKPATAKGDNYTSDMYRVSVTFLRIVEGQKISETKSFVAKVAPQGGSREEMISDCKFFDIEMAMMSETLPHMSRLLNGFGGILLAARCFHVQREKPVFLILEDLAPKGFRMADRQTGLDLDHCLLAIRNLAAFHASSVALVEKDPQVPTQYKRGMFHKEHSASMRLFFNQGVKTLSEEVAKWPELSPRIAEKIAELSDFIYDKTCEAAVCRKDDFNVINHGDFWTNNMMFRYDERQKPTEHTFVDFQICHYGSPAVDLLYFFATSPSDDVRMHHRELILRKYYTSLVEIMTILKCNTEAPSFEDLKKILRTRALCEIVPAFTILPVILTDKDEVKSLDEMITLDGKYENPAYQGKLYREVMTRLLPVYDNMGLLDL